MSHTGGAGLLTTQRVDFTDLVNFWNLRACDIEIFFYDSIALVAAWANPSRHGQVPHHGAGDG